MVTEEENVNNEEPDILLTSVTKAVSTGFSVGTGDLSTGGISCATVIGTAVGSRTSGSSPGLTSPSSTHNTLMTPSCHPGAKPGHGSGNIPTSKSLEGDSTKKPMTVTVTAGPTATGVTAVTIAVAMILTVPNTNDIVPLP